ncbi:MAG: oligosaccharide flippase family protein [Lachnospiraceae bacterium]|nr:oligosaccharide flippase family protein [Lachnospiraceae bacterium]
MSDTKTPDLKKNFIYRMLYEILLFAIPLVTLPYISRVLGPEGVGAYSYSYSVVSYFMLFGALGTAAYGMREIARNRDDRQACSRLFWQIEGMSIFTCLICLIVWALIILSGSSHYLFFLALTPFLLGTMCDITWFYMGLERIGAIVLSSGVIRIAGVVLTFTLVRSKEDVILFCIINSVIFLGANLSMWLFLPRYLVRAGWDGLHLKQHLRETCIYFIPTIASSVYLVMDKTLIGLITDSAYENGYYEQASKLIAVAQGISYLVFNAVAGARFSYLFAAKQEERIRTGIRRSADFVFLMSYGAAFGLLGITHSLVPVFFGAGYEPVEFLICLMLPLIPVVAISNCLGNQYYTPAGKRAQSAMYIVAGAVLNLLLNLALIPILGAKGAVLASLAAESLISVLYLAHCEGMLSVRMIGALSWKRLIAGICMAGAVRLLGTVPLHAVIVLCLQIVCGAILYLLLLVLLRDGLVIETCKKYIHKTEEL